MITVFLGAVCAFIAGLMYLQLRTPSRRGSLTPTGRVLAGVMLLLVAVTAAWFFGAEGHDRVSVLAHGTLVKLWALYIALSAFLGLFTRDGIRTSVPAASTQAAAPTAPARQFTRLASVGGVPIFVHWSFLFSGALVAALAGADIAVFAVYCAAYCALFALHEGAHALAARRLGLRVHGIVLMGNGGRCVVQVPRGVGDAAQVYAAGIGVQALLLLATVAVVALLGEPDTRAGAAVVLTFTWVNALLILVNLLPGRSSDGLPNDGAVLWGLFRHVRHGEPHPLAAHHAASPVFDLATRLLTIEGMKPDGFVSGIELLNDDTSPMELVVEMLDRFGGLDHEAATAAMMTVHRTGGLLLPLPNLAIAELAAEAITREARARGHALVCRAVTATATA